MPKLEIDVRAEAEIESIAEYHETKREGYGAKFLEELENAKKLILQFPEAFPIHTGQTRRIPLSLFRYSVFYKISGERIRIQAVFHQSRDPKRLKKRLS